MGVVDAMDAESTTARWAHTAPPVGNQGMLEVDDGSRRDGGGCRLRGVVDSLAHPLAQAETQR